MNTICIYSPGKYNGLKKYNPKFAFLLEALNHSGNRISNTA